MNSLGIDRDPAKTRVVVAMSGGVDSSVVAAMLKTEGYDVIGITLQLYDRNSELHRNSTCCSAQDLDDARQVADMLRIPHHVLNVEDHFHEEVVERFADSYLAGATPVPCVDCNRSIKFKDMLKATEELGADLLATGHYVISQKLDDGQYALFRAADIKRDQSYFLYATSPQQLARLRFPLGQSKNKEEIRSKARQLGLSIADKADSQDICFISNGRYSDLIRKLRPGAAKKGEIVHIDGRILGEHDGIIHFTVGQRRGLGISSAEPLYVIRLDAENARVIVGPKEALASHHIYVGSVCWYGSPDAAHRPEGIKIAARVRSTRPPKEGILHLEADGQAVIELSAPEEGVSPGQACVFYDSSAPYARVLGGGTILKDRMS